VLIINEKNVVYLWDKNKPGKLPKISTKVNSVVFSPNNQFFATAGEDGMVKLWKFDDLEKPKPFLEFETYQKNIQVLHSIPWIVILC
jgi:WD40 repeat protein